MNSIVGFLLFYNLSAPSLDAALAVQSVMLNDWLGSIPVFHAQIEKGRVTSTVEPVTVAAGGYTADDFLPPGLLKQPLIGVRNPGSSLGVGILLSCRFLPWF